MNISSASSSAGWFANVIKTSPAPSIAGSGFEEATKKLTTADRDTIKSTTGIDIRDNGEMGMPMSMTALDYGTAMASIGQLAASRASGQSADLSGSDFLQALAARGYSNSARRCHSVQATRAC